MGLLDSNKLSLMRKHGTFTCDLTSNIAQNVTTFGGREFNTLKLVVSDIPSDIDVIISVSGGIESNYASLKIYDESHNETFIQNNGTYLIDVSGLNGVYWYVTRQASTGSCTIQWSLSVTQEVNTDIFSLNKNTIDQKVIFGNTTISLENAGNLKYIPIDYNYECIELYVSSINGVCSIVENYKMISPIYNANGEIVSEINAVGLYFIPVKGIYGSDKVAIRCDTPTTEGSMQVRADYLKKVPYEVTESKPIQKLASAVINVSTSNIFVALPETITRYLTRFFKYYFVAFSIKNNGSAVVKTVTLTSLPFYSTTFSGKGEEILVKNDYAGQSDWKEMKASFGIRLYATIPDYQEGDIMEIEMYGIR